MTDPERPTTDDDAFALARDTWRQFHALCIDRPAPTQPVIDARLKLYQRAREVAAMRHFAGASLLLAGLAKALTDIGPAFQEAGSTTDALLFAIACLVVVIAGVHALTQMRDAIDARAIARRIDVEPIPWSRVDSLFADTLDADVRGYLDDVRNQGRTLRRAETAVLFERARGGSAANDTSEAAFRRFVRGRPAVRRREFLTGAACIFAVLLVNQSVAEPIMLLPPLFVLAAWSLADLLGTLIELRTDPWELREGGAGAQALRATMQLDLSPPVAILLAVIAIHVAVSALPAG